MEIQLALEIKERRLTPKIPYNFIRILSRVTFIDNKNQALSQGYSAIVDTGAPISVVPHSYWKGLKIHVLRKAELEGINQRKPCRIPCHLIVG